MTTGCGFFGMHGINFRKLDYAAIESKKHYLTYIFVILHFGSIINNANALFHGFLMYGDTFRVT